ncbi:MAG: TSCPD domain-containing protein [Desulfovibrio sp.]|nr:TSCPD domain-containing protein [Desulfovibrio sp.]
MDYVYTPQRVCAKQFFFNVDEADRTLRDFQFTGGCFGNLQGIRRLLRGMKIDEIVDRLSDMPICPMSKVSSCPEEICKALIELRGLLDKGGEASRPVFGLSRMPG